MTNFTLTILFFLSLFSSSSSEFQDDFKSSETTIAMESNLVITEIMYHPNSSDSAWEWIEVYNKGTEPIDLTGYVLDDNNNTKQGSANIFGGSISGGGVAILFDSDVTLEEFTAVWGDLNAIPVSGWPGLNNSGDSVGIWDSFEAYDGDNVSQLNVIEQVIYDDANGWVDSNAASSIFLTDVDEDNTLGASWALSEIGIADAFQSNELHGNSGNDIGSPGIVPIENDTTPPTIECPEMIETNHDEGECSSVVPLLVPTAMDDISTEFTFSAVRSDGLDLEEPFPVGDTMVTWTATDEANNTSLPCDQMIRVVEIELPTAIAQNITVELDENGMASIAPEDLDNPETPSFDNCGIDAYMASRTEFTCADLDTPVSVEFSVLDANGNTSTVTNVEVTVLDKLKPTFTCGADIITTSSDGGAVPIEDVVEPIVTDNCDTAPVLTYSRSDEQELNAPFEVGTTTINWQAADASGNVEECIQTIVVESTASMDNDILAFSIPNQVGATSIDQTENTIEVLMPIGTDVTALVPSFDISDSATSIPELGDTIDFTEPIIYVVKAQDGSEQEWTVTVNVQEDTTPPTFEVKGNSEDFVTELEVGDAYVVGEITNVIDENLTVSEILGDDQVDTSVEGGPFLVSYSVSDGMNTTTIIETVIVSMNQELLSITDFMLVNADTNEDIFLLEEGMEINTTDLPTMNLNIRANATDDVMSVQLSLAGEQSITRTENVPPFALYGDFPAENYFGNDLGLGTYSISATPYTEKGLEGEMGQEIALNFSITEACSNFAITILDTAHPSTCSGVDGFALLSNEGAQLPVTYSWSHDEDNVSDLALDLKAGIYTVTATDANNCSAELTFELKDPEIPQVTLSSFSTVSEDSGSFELTGGLPEGGSYSGEGVTNDSFDPSVGIGTYEITYTYIDVETACENSAVQTIEVVPPVLKVQSFTLVNADTNQDIMDLTEGMQINISTLPTLNLNVRANTTEDVKSVRLMLDGDLTTSRTENVVPFALYGDFPAENYFGSEFTPGSFSITAIPYSETQLGGEMGTPLSMNFELLDDQVSDKSANDMSVSPNPASTTTTLNFQKPAELKIIYVYDILGRRVGSYKGKTIKDDDRYILNIESIPAGTYYIKSYDNKGNRYQRQVIINK